MFIFNLFENVNGRFLSNKLDRVSCIGMNTIFLNYTCEKRENQVRDRQEKVQNYCTVQK